MARIAGVNIPDNKHLNIALTYIYGIGITRAQNICDSLDLKYSIKVNQLSESDLEQEKRQIIIKTETNVFILFISLQKIVKI